MESELFGHRRGAFTEPSRTKVGCSRRRTRTIFLDEIGDMPLEMQGKLPPRAPGRRDQAVGDVATRVCAFAHRRDETGIWRPRCNARNSRGPLSIGSMRSRSPSWLLERMEDLPVLAYHFLRKAEAKVNKKVGADLD